MTAPFIGDILRDHLRNPDGPEVMVLMTRESRGLAERLVMGTNRDRLIRRLKRHDHHDRLRVCYPGHSAWRGRARRSWCIRSS